MRDVVLYSLLSLDGVAEEPSDWMFEVDEEVFAGLADVIAQQDDVLLGRGTYDYWVDYWPTSEVQPFADFINSTRKHVFTSTALTRPWANARIADATPADYVTELRGSPGGDIGVHGSISLAQELLRADLIDRLELVVAPAIAASGARLLTAGLSPQRFALRRASGTRTGSVLLSYRRRAHRSDEDARTLQDPDAARPEQ